MLEIYLKFMTALTAPRKEEEGATAVEYGLLVALIAAIIVVVVGLLGTEVSTAFQTVLDNMP